MVLVHCECFLDLSLRCCRLPECNSPVCNIEVRVNKKEHTKKEKIIIIMPPKRCFSMSTNFITGSPVELVLELHQHSLLVFNYSLSLIHLDNINLSGDKIISPLNIDE